MKTCTRAAAAIALLCAAGHAAAQHRTIYVDQRAPAGGDGASWSTAFNDLHAALAVVRTPGLADTSLEVRVATGVYKPAPPGGSRSIKFIFGQYWNDERVFRLALSGGFAGRGAPNPDARDLVNTPTILSGDLNGDDQPGFVNRSDNTDSILQVQSDSDTLVNIDGFIVRGGGLPVTPGFGSYALDFWDAHMSEFSTISNCLFTDNQGGGLSVGVANADVLNCDFIGNRAEYGGGGLTVVYQARVRDCTFIGNFAPDDGGGAYMGFLVPFLCLVERCLFADNHTNGNGGGLYSAGSSVQSCLFVNNSAGGAGGGAFAATTTLVGCTSVNNTAAWGGGVHFGNTCASYNSICAFNTATIAGQQASHGDGVFTIRNSIFHGGPADDRLYLVFGGDVNAAAMRFNDPLFLDADGPDNNAATWQDNDYRPALNSPCIDGGTQAIPGPGPLYEYTPFDIENNPRSVAAMAGGPPAMDLGAYEYQRPIFCLADFNNDGDTGTDDDIRDFFAAIAGSICSTCNSPDFNGDGDSGTDADIESFFRVLAGGPC